MLHAQVLLLLLCSSSFATTAAKNAHNIIPVPRQVQQQGKLLQGKRIGAIISNDMTNAETAATLRLSATSNGWMSHQFYKLDDCGGAALYQYGYPLSTCFQLFDDDSNDDDAENEVAVGSITFTCDEDGGVLTKTVYSDTACSAEPSDETAVLDTCIDADFGSLESYIYTCTSKSIYPITSAREYTIRTGYTQEDCQYRSYMSYTEAFQADYCLSFDGASSFLTNSSVLANESARIFIYMFDSPDCAVSAQSSSVELAQSCQHHEINDDDFHYRSSSSSSSSGDSSNSTEDGQTDVAEVWSYQFSSKHYYDGINASAVDDDLKGQLQALVNPHTVYTYDDAWTAFAAIDIYLPGYNCSANLSHIPDIYSTYCWDPEKNVPDGECGNYQQEGDCYNREHCWPKSWFGGFDEGQNAQTDLFELWPSDGYVNGLRGNLPYGYVSPSTVTYTSTSGCLIGTCDTDEYSGQCFEVSDVLKGDLARSYFYLSTAYWRLWSCCDEAGVDGSDIKPWMEDMLRQWHANDPVDENEMNRNDEIFFNWQHNRNPFIDHPEWVDQISDF